MRFTTYIARPVPTLMLAILSLQVFLFSPHSVYITNVQQFTISLPALLELCLVPVLTAFLVFFPVIRSIPDRYVPWCSVMLATFGILVWFQGNVLLWDYGILDGRAIVWQEFTWRGWIDASVWVITLMLVMKYQSRIHKPLINIALFIFALQFVTACFTTLQNWDLAVNRNTHANQDTYNNLLKFHPAENILHIVVDGFQSDVFEELVQQELFKERYQNSLRGFVFYRETLGAFPYTSFALPAFLAAELYDNRMPKETFIDNVLRGDTVISAAMADGYEIDIASNGGYLFNKYSNLPYTNIYNLSDIAGISSDWDDAAAAIDIGLFRAVPHALKRYVYNDQRWLFLQHTFPEELFQFGYFAHTYFLKKFSLEMNTGRARPVYKFIHIMNTHNPMVVDNSCGYTGKPVAMDRKSLTIQSLCTLDTLVHTLDSMQALGIYDKTLILIHGDHGGWVPNYRQGPAVQFKSGDKAPEWLTSLASPLLILKKPNAGGEFRISNAPVSLLDIPDTIADIMKFDMDFGYQSVNQLNPGDERKRIFRFYFWQDDEWNKEYTAPIQEFSISGSHYEEKWVPGEIYFPPQL